MVFNLIQLALLLVGLIFLYKGSANLIKGYNIGKIISMFKYKTSKKK